MMQVVVSGHPYTYVHTYGYHRIEVVIGFETFYIVPVRSNPFVLIEAF